MTVKKRTTDLIDVPEAAAIVGCHPRTMRRWIRRGLLHAVQLPMGRLKVSRRDIEQLSTPTTQAKAVSYL